MQKLKRYLLIAAVTCVAVIALSLSLTASADSPKKFRVGVIAPLSGPLAEYGLATRNGIDFAQIEHPDLFKEVEFLYEDSQWDAKTAVSAFNKLRTFDHIDLAYNWGNPTSEAVAPIAERYKTPLLAMSSDPKISTGKSFVIRAINPAKNFGEVLAHYLAAQKYKKIGVVIADNSYVQGVYDGLKSVFGSETIIEIIDRYNVSDQDFRTAITKIRSHSYDAIGVFLISGQVSTFYRQLSTQGIKLPTFGADFFESNSEIQAAQGGMNGAVFSNMDVADDFRSNYVSKYRNDSQIAFAGNAHDMAVVIGKLFNSQNLSASEIMAKFQSVKDIQGVNGIFSYQKSPEGDPHFEFPIKVKRIVGEQIVTLGDG